MSNTKATNIKLVREFPEDDDYGNPVFHPRRAYLSVNVDYDGSTYNVGVSVGVQPHHDGSAIAAGTIVGLLDAWWEDSTDWADLPNLDARDAVMHALERSAKRLLREAIERRPS